MRGRTQDGISLIELLIVVAMIALLLGIVFAATASVREKGRQTVCISNLRQIGMAISMYRQDWSGGDPNGRMEYWQLGLPPGPVVKLQLDPYVKNREIWLCPNDSSPRREVQIDFPFIRSYGNRWLAPGFEEKVSRCGEETPLFIDFNHGWKQHRVRYLLLLRLNNHVKGKLILFPPEPDNCD